MTSTPSWDRAARAVLAVQGVLFLALAHSEAPRAWTALSPYFAEIAADLLGAGGSPLDGYDGLVFGPLFYAALEAPLLAALGRVGAVHTIATAGLALAATWLTYRFIGRVASPRAGFLAALLVAFPPPNTWGHQHFGAYHVLPLVLVPAAGLLAFEDGASRRRWAGAGLLVGASVGASLGAISLGPPLLAARLGAVAKAHGRGAALRATVAACIGAGLGLAPMAYKAWIHVPWGGAATDARGAAAEAVKPLFLGGATPADLLARPLVMLGRDLPYGLHFGQEGMAAAGWVFAGAAYAAVAWAAWAAWRARRSLPAWAPILAVPPAVVGVGALTGWFVFHPGDGPGWTRDARHIVGLTLALAWLMAITADAQRGRARRAIVIVAALAAASVVTQVAAFGSADGGVHAPSPWRLEGRFVAGFFRGPAFAGEPEAAAGSCAELEGASRRGCLRGVALSFGHAAAGIQRARRPVGPTLRETTRRLGPADGVDVDVLHGLGWAHAQAAFGRPARAVLPCRDASLSAPEVEACVEGVGWGFAMDFADRPGAVATAVGSLEDADAGPFARGVGVLIRDLLRDGPARERRCARELPPRLVPACRAGASR